MTTPEQPEQRTFTRKEMRQIRDTSSTPIVSADQVPQAEQPSPPVAAAPAPLPRPAAPVEVAPAPVPDASVDLGVAPLTRRQARQQERIRTASVPVITPDMAAAHAEAARLKAEEAAASSTDDSAESAPAAETVNDAPAEVAEPTDSETADTETPDAAADAAAEPEVAASADDDAERVTLSPSFGSELLVGEAAPTATAASFDQLLARGSAATGAVSTPNALILTQTPEGAIMGPVAATGEVLITGTFALPEGLGSQGHAPGTADGREADAVLIDGELPAHSSPTPIAASAAVSTIKTTGDIIRPPAPEKGSRLMLALAITAGVLAIAVVGVLIVAVATGVFA